MAFSMPPPRRRRRRSPPAVSEEIDVAIYGDPDASRLCYLALHALQHRGQEGAGIVAVHDRVLRSVTGIGLVSDVINESKLTPLSPAPPPSTTSATPPLASPTSTTSNPSSPDTGSAPSASA